MKRTSLIVRILLGIVLAGFGLILALAVLFVALPAKQAAKKVVTAQPDVVQEQFLLEKSLLADYAKDNYSPQAPYVIQDPYGHSPLTALALFETPNASRVTVEVLGKDTSTTLTYRLDAPVTHHEIPIIGLYAGVTNEVKLTVESNQGTSSLHTLALKTERLPDDLPGRVVIVSKPEKMEPGWTLVNSETYKFILDQRGDVRWYLNFKSNNILTVLPNGNLLTAYLPTPPYTHGDAPDKLVETDLLGKFSTFYFTPFIHHEVIPYRDGFISTVGESIYQFDREVGTQKSNSLSLKQFFPDKRIFEYIDDSESLHINAIATGGELGDDLLVSARNQHALVLLDYPEGKLKWILGARDGWTSEFDSYLLKPVGDGFEWFWMQHAPQVLPDLDGDATTLDILVFDNGTFRDFTADLPNEKKYSRMVHYRIHQRELTVEQIWEYGKERGHELFSSIKSNAVYLKQTGNFLGTFGEVQSLYDVKRFDGVITEVTAQKEVVFEMRLTDTRSIYRSQRVRVEELVREFHLGEHPGKYRVNDTPYKIYPFPLETNQTLTTNYAHSLYALCMDKFGSDCLDWIYRGNRLGLDKITGYSPLRLYVDEIKLVNRDLHLKGRVELAEESRNLFLVLKSETDIFTFNISEASFGEPNEKGLSTFFVNYLDTRMLPQGSYRLSFFTRTSSGIRVVDTEYQVGLSDINGVE